MVTKKRVGAEVNGMTSKPRPMVAKTIPQTAASARVTGDSDDRNRVIRYCLKHQWDDPIYHEAHTALVRKAQPGQSPEIAAVFSRTRNQTYVDRIGLLEKLDVINSLMELQGPPIRPASAHLGARLLNIASSKRSFEHFGSDLDGLCVVIAESGCRAQDRAALRELNSLVGEGFRINDGPAGLQKNIAERTRDLLPTRASWRPEVRFAFASPEKVHALVQETIEAERWAEGLEELFNNDQEELQTIMGALGRFASATSPNFSNVMRDIARLLGAIRPGPENISVDVSDIHIGGMWGG